MSTKRKMGKFIVTIVVLAVMTGFMFSGAFHLVMSSTTDAEASFWETFSIAFWFGPAFGLILVIMRFTLGRIVEEAIQFESRGFFSEQMGEVFSEWKYRRKSVTDDSTEWVCEDAVNGLYMESVYVRLEENQATINGPWAIARAIKKKSSRV